MSENVAIREDYRLRIFENGMLGKIRPKKNEGEGGR
jgi:hypothetical protein